MCRANADTPPSTDRRGSMSRSAAPRQRCWSWVIALAHDATWAAFFTTYGAPARARVLDDVPRASASASGTRGGSGSEALAEGPCTWTNDQALRMRHRLAVSI